MGTYVTWPCSSCSESIKRPLYCPSAQAAFIPPPPFVAKLRHNRSFPEKKKKNFPFFLVSSVTGNFAPPPPPYASSHFPFPEEEDTSPPLFLLLLFAKYPLSQIKKEAEVKRHCPSFLFSPSVLKGGEKKKSIRYCAGDVSLYSRAFKNI